MTCRKIRGVIYIKSYLLCLVSNGYFQKEINSWRTWRAMNLRLKLEYIVNVDINAQHSFFLIFIIYIIIVFTWLWWNWHFIRWIMVCELVLESKHPCRIQWNFQTVYLSWLFKHEILISIELMKLLFMYLLKVFLHCLRVFLDV